MLVWEHTSKLAATARCWFGRTPRKSQLPLLHLRHSRCSAFTCTSCTRTHVPAFTACRNSLASWSISSVFWAPSKRSRSCLLFATFLFLRPDLQQWWRNMLCAPGKQQPEERQQQELLAVTLSDAVHGSGTERRPAHLTCTDAAYMCKSQAWQAASCSAAAALLARQSATGGSAAGAKLPEANHPRTLLQEQWQLKALLASR